MDQHTNQPPEPTAHDSQSDTLPIPKDHRPPELLFEPYEPRSVSTIVAQQQALRESQAAETAAIIFAGVDQLELTFPKGQQEDRPDCQSEHPGHKPLFNRPLDETFEPIRTEHLSLRRRLVTPGAQCIYSLITITLIGGLMGLSASINSPALMLAAEIISPTLLPICIWKWIRWLDSRPYYYRLLTSLDEDARNLLNHRLLWKPATKTHRSKSTARLKPTSRPPCWYINSNQSHLAA